MVKLMIDGLGGDYRKTSRLRDGSCMADSVQCFHVNARLSKNLPDVGSFRIGKAFRLLRYCLEAVWLRFFYGAKNFYYIPAPAKRTAFYRDCIVLLLCRPFFHRIIFHWHATGLTEWLQQSGFSWEQRMAQALLGVPSLSVILANSLSTDAVYFRSKRIAMVPNGIPDPCPTFDDSVVQYRVSRFAERLALFEGRTRTSSVLQKYHVVFLANCTRDKGLFDALDAVLLANKDLCGQGLPIRIHLTVAGAFLSVRERREFDSWCYVHPNEVNYVGFIDLEAKAKLLQQSDCLCFPSFYSAEGQPVSIIEGMAFGLNIVASAWRAIPELLPKNYPFLISERSNSMLARALLQSMRVDLAAKLRRRYREEFTDKCYLKSLEEALQLV